MPFLSCPSGLTADAGARRAWRAAAHMAQYGRPGPYGSPGGDEDPYFEGEHERPDTIGGQGGQAARSWLRGAGPDRAPQPLCGRMLPHRSLHAGYQAARNHHHQARTTARLRTAATTAACACAIATSRSALARPSACSAAPLRALERRRRAARRAFQAWQPAACREALRRRRARASSGAAGTSRQAAAAAACRARKTSGAQEPPAMPACHSGRRPTRATLFACGGRRRGASFWHTRALVR